MEFCECVPTDKGGEEGGTTRSESLFFVRISSEIFKPSKEVRDTVEFEPRICPDYTKPNT